MADEEGEPGLSRSWLNKLIKDTIPNIRVSNECRDLLYQCCVEFIRVVSTEANRISLEQQRKTIGHEHIFKAMEHFGLGEEYVEASGSVLRECEAQAARRLKRQNSRLDKCGIPEEELLRQQQELFQKAKAEQADAAEVEMRRLEEQMMRGGERNGGGGGDADDDYDAPDDNDS